ncbi:MAG TPA: efflux RND transporter periplasmic adaptor subunit [Vicinamibacteria bacterium]|nr:efflux RND transporter periplasmic adaptor subunit [Vicinamibacteria bacterium]
MKNTTLLAMGILGVGLVAATVLQARGAAAPAGRPPAAADAMGRQVAAEGRVAAYPDAEVRVAAERGGRLVRVRVEEGQAVRKGDLLAEIESDELRAALAQARARLAEAEAQSSLAEATLVRRERLAGEGVLSAHDLDAARSDLAAARARIATWRAESARQSAQLARSRVVAPLAGVVTLRSVEGGETVETGQPLFVVADLARLRVEAEADEADAPLLSVGAPVTVTAQGWTGQGWQGRVEEVAHAVTPRRLKPQDPSRPTDTRVLAVKVAFAEPSPLKLGATVELRIRHH